MRGDGHRLAARGNVRFPDVIERLSLVLDECESDIIGFAFSRSACFCGALCGMLPMSEGLYAGDDYGHYERVVREGRLVRMWGKYYKRLIADVDADYTGLCGLTYAEDLLQSMPLARAARSFPSRGTSVLLPLQPSGLRCTLRGQVSG